MGHPRPRILPTLQLLRNAPSPEARGGWCCAQSWFRRNASAASAIREVLWLQLSLSTFGLKSLGFPPQCLKFFQVGILRSATAVAQLFFYPLKSSPELTIGLS